MKNTKNYRKAVVPMGGVTSGLLTVAHRVGTNAHGEALWELRCKCGNAFIASGTNIRKGRYYSCGCKAKPDGIDVKLTYPEGHRYNRKIKPLDSIPNEKPAEDSKRPSILILQEGDRALFRATYLRLSDLRCKHEQHAAAINAAQEPLKALWGSVFEKGK